MMNKNSTVPEIFDRNRRAALRNRSWQRGGSNNFMWRHLADDLADRLAYVSRDFKDVLIIGPMASFAAMILGDRKAITTLAALSNAEAVSVGGVVVEEDRLPFVPGSFDLIITAGTLDSVNDLPGALIQMRRCLRPDGLLLGAMFGSGTLSQLKAAMMLADGERAMPHIHPQIDLRSAADLLTRTGFALPVVDNDTIAVRYSSLNILINDVRDMGAGNALSGSRPYFGKGALGRLTRAWAEYGDSEGKVTEQFSIIHFSGWSPSPDQPRPAKRGSGTVSLANVLKPKPE